MEGPVRKGIGKRELGARLWDTVNPEFTLDSGVFGAVRILNSEISDWCFRNVILAVVCALMRNEGLVWGYSSSNKT